MVEFIGAQCGGCRKQPALMLGRRYSGVVHEKTLRGGKFRSDPAERSKRISGPRCNECGSCELEDGTAAARGCSPKTWYTSCKCRV